MTTWFLRAVALGVLAMIIAATVLIWPFSYLGYDYATDTIIFVAPHSPASDAGMQRGDRIITLYGRPWDEVVRQWSILPLLGPRSTPVAMTVARGGQRVMLQLVRRPPSAAVQLGKAVLCGLALLCWLTGYLLGTVRRNEVTGSSLVSLFWLLLSGALGTFMFGVYASFPLHAVLQWMFLTILTPLGIAIHVWFPPRPVSLPRLRLAHHLLLGSIGAANLAWLIALSIAHPSLQTIVATLANWVPAALGVCFAGSGIVLASAYRHATIAYVRRQIRVIGSACFVVAAVWLLVLVLPGLVGNAPLIDEHWIDSIAGLIPLAYLVSGVMPNLYVVDRLALRVGAGAWRRRLGSPHSSLGLPRFWHCHCRKPPSGWRWVPWFCISPPITSRCACFQPT